MNAVSGKISFNKASPGHVTHTYAPICQVQAQFSVGYSMNGKWYDGSCVTAAGHGDKPGRIVNHRRGAVWGVKFEGEPEIKFYWDITDLVHSTACTEDKCRETCSIKHAAKSWQRKCTWDVCSGCDKCK